MLNTIFKIYTQSHFIGEGFRHFIASLYPTASTNICSSPTHRINEATNEIMFHIFIISAGQKAFFEMMKHPVDDGMHNKVICCPMVNDLNMIPLIKGCNFDGLISVESINPISFGKLIDRTLENNIYIDDFYTTEIIKSKYDQIESCLNSISDREAEVLEKIAQDKSNGQIAKELGLSIRTINAHKRNLLRKCNAHTMEYVIDITSRYGNIYNKFKSADR